MDDMGFRLSQREKDLATATHKLTELQELHTQEDSRRRALEDELVAAQQNHARVKLELETEISVLRSDNEQIKKSLVKLIK